MAQTYPDPPYDQVKFGLPVDLDALPDPPTSFKPLGYTKIIRYTSHHRPTRADALQWRKFYFWGIKYNFGQNPSIQVLERALRKLLYYTTPSHCPANYDEFADFKRDAGPRTIDYTKIPFSARSNATLRSQGLLYMPVSRHFPNLPDEAAFLPLGFTRPADVPAHWSDAMVCQSQCIVTEHITAKSDDSNEDDDDSDNSDDDDAAGAAPMGLIVPTGIGTHQGTKDEVKEAVERAIMKVTYLGLERHPSAAARDPPRDRTAVNEEDIQRSAISLTLINSHVRLKRDDLGQLYVDRGGDSWALKGRGPVYSGDSSVVDCIITAGKFLDAGSTNADRSDPGWAAKLSRLEHTFIELSDVNWDLCTPETGTQLKRELVQIIKQRAPQFEFGDTTKDAVPLLWSMVAEHLDQFASKYDQTEIPCQCSTAPTTHATRSLRYVRPEFQPADSTGVPMKALFERSFQPSQKLPCQACNDGEHGIERSFYPLPLRLVMAPDPRASLLDHTETVTFTYRPSGEADRNTHATYRWLGGIYQDQQGALRVFWNDTKRGEVDKGRVCQYDSKLNGLIVSEELDPKPAHRVDPRWWHRKPVPLLFYERVMNPTDEILRGAIESIREMRTDNLTGVPFLVSHGGWPTTEHTKRSRPGYPWQPNAVERPPDAGYFQMAESPYNRNQNTATHHDTHDWDDVTLPPLRESNLSGTGPLNASIPQPLEPAFTPSPARSSSIASLTGFGAFSQGLGAPTSEHGFRSERPTDTDEDIEMEM
ncbi:hypothetical protein BJX64DRAFT_270963 [Aspergillus heterothallicus]